MRWGLVWVLGALAIACGNEDSPSGNGLNDAGADAEGGTLEDAGADADADAGEVCTTLNDSGVWLPEDGNGAFDPSVATDPVSGRVWMSYSSIDGPVGEGKVSTWLVHSDDGGQTWCGAARINAAEDVTAADRPPGHESEPSHWSHEVSALVIDASAPAAERWKLFWHRYLHAEDTDPKTEDRRFEFGWLALRAAATPEALFDAPEQVILAAEAYYAAPAIQSYNERFGSAKYRLCDLSSDLKDCLVATEPAALSGDGGLQLWMGCGSLSGLRIISLELAGGSLSYLGAPLAPSDAAALDPAFSGFNAPDAYRDANSDAQLLVSPVGGGLYKGCLRYSVAGGAVTSAPSVVKAHPAGALLSGACAYDPGLTATGTLFGEIHADTPQLRLFALGTAP
ncbi:MAG: exo-alpha-sialidase [Myxococcales bacterium]|nr:exo-alpha-sialidase [Myxococcales bacterium]